MSPPLEHRLPNPPPLLVGRSAEVESVLAAIHRSPATIVYGLESIGKVSVVLDVLHRRLPESLGRAVYVRGIANEPIAATVVRALARSLGLETTPNASGEALSAVALELAESAQSWLVIDSADDPSWQLFELAGRYARASRWIATSVNPPTAAVLQYAVPIGALGNAALEQLANEWGRALPAEQRALASAAALGSPLRLRRIIAERIARGPDSLIEADSASGRVLDVLASTELALSLEDLRALAPDSDESNARSLAERGLVSVHAGTVELHSAARAVITSRRPDRIAAIAPAVAKRLAGSEDPGARAEAIRLALMLRDVDLAANLLERHGAQLFLQGYGHRLSGVLVAIDDPRLSRWRIRAAVELGDGDVLPNLLDEATLAKHPADRVMLAEALMRANRLEAAVATVSMLDDPAARLLAARAFATRGELDRAAHELDKVRERKRLAPELAAAAAALGARVDALSGNVTRARTALTSVRGRVADLPPTTACDVLQSIAATHHDLGDLTTTTEILDQLDRMLVADPLCRFVGRRSRLVRSIVKVEQGDLDGAAATLDELEKATKFASLHRPFIAMISAQLAHARGTLCQATVALAAVDEHASGSGYIGAWAAALEARLTMIDPTLATARVPPPERGIWPAIARLHHARLALRNRKPPPDLSADLALAGDHAPVELWFAARALSWERALAAGYGGESLRTALDTASRCAELQFRIFEAEALAGVIDAAFVSHEDDARDDAIARLEVIGRAMSSPRFEAEAAFARELAAGAPPERLEAFATGTMSPRVRRARGLLGDAAALDPIDHAVVLATTTTRAQLLAGPANGWGTGWGIDRRRRCVWRSDGSVVDLADKPQLWRLLDAITGSPGGIAKEALVVQVWGVPYHPLRHDKLLHNSIHKLRKLIEDRPTAPKRLPTTDDGYRIGDDSPARVLDSD